jgi:hypothetical protein
MWSTALLVPAKEAIRHYKVNDIILSNSAYSYPPREPRHVLRGPGQYNTP